MPLIKIAKSIIGNTIKLDLVVITFSLAVSITYIVSHYYWGTIGGTVGIVLAAALFLFGQVFIAMRGAYDRYKKSTTWERSILPTLSVVRLSLESNLVLLSNSSSRENAYKDGRYIYHNPDGEEYRDSFRWFLDSIAPSDFVSETSSNSTLPLISRLKSLRETILIPTRDLLRWGLMMNRIYEKGEPEESKQLFGQSVLEMVSSLYLIECERFLSYLEGNLSVLRMPNELAGKNIAFVEFEYTYISEKDNCQFTISSGKSVTSVVPILIDNLNSIAKMGFDLTQYNSLPAFPYVRTINDDPNEFCARYLTTAWYRSVLTYIGWNLVHPTVVR